MLVLLIEDNEDDAYIIREKLSQSSDTAIELVHEKGLERLAQGGVDLVMTDLNLPDSQALETFHKVYASANEIPVIVVTGTYQDGALAIEAVSNGAQDYITKEDLDGRLLVRTIRFAIERKRMEKRMQKAQQDLEEKISELERLNDFMMGREERILELKREINQFCEQAGNEAKYTI
jgi:DNA-binding NtrC family response regulator